MAYFSDHVTHFRSFTTFNGLLQLKSQININTREENAQEEFKTQNKSRY